MEGWEELNPEEKAELASVFSGHLHDLVVSADVEAESLYWNQASKCLLPIEISSTDKIVSCMQK